MYVHAYHHIRTKSLVYIHTRTRTRTHNQILCATERRVRRGLRSSAAFSPLLNATSTSALLPAFFSVTFTLVAALRTTEELQSTPHISNICSTTYVKKKPATFLGICLSFYIMHGDARQHTATYWQSENEQLHRTATHCNTWNALQHIGWRSGILAPAARGLGGGGSSTHTHTHTHTLGRGQQARGVTTSTATHCSNCSTLQHTAAHCSTLTFRNTCDCYVWSWWKGQQVQAWQARCSPCRPLPLWFSCRWPCSRAAPPPKHKTPQWVCKHMYVICICI